MDVLVAVSAVLERQAPEADGCCARRRGVAFGTGHVLVLSGKREPGGAVIEFAGGLPPFRGVALPTVGPELPFVNILVTCAALLRQSKMCAAEILYADAGAFTGRDVFRLMAARAGKPGVPSGERPAC